MKKFIIISILAISSTFVYAQEKLEFELVFGSYINDHINKEFHVQERIWKLIDNELSYSIDAHGRRYENAIPFGEKERILILGIIDKNQLRDESVIKDLSEDYLNKRDWKLIIKGYIKINDEIQFFDIKSNSPSALEGDETAQSLKKLEDLFYRISEEG